MVYRRRVRTPDIAGARVHLVCAGALAIACVSASDDAASATQSTATTTDAGSTGTADAESETSADSGAAECTRSLLDHQAWTALETAADPLADHRPDMIECNIAGWYVENDKLEIDTFYCNYLALTQPLLEDVAAGDTLELGLYYFDLLAPAAATAHVAVLIDGAVVWEREVEIPGGPTPAPAHVYDERFASPISASAGAPIVIHLHNHGQNTWTFDRLDRC